MGRLSRWSLMERSSLMPKVGALPSAFSFHSGTSGSPACAMPRPRSSIARWRSPSSGMGSSQGRLRSRGMASSSVRCCCTCSSRRSLPSADCVMAARCSDPSGFFTILIGLISMPLLLEWPLRNSGSWGGVSDWMRCDIYIAVKSRQAELRL
ncbi:MAG: hypothetical protein J3K34DRAFT_405041, partial [Monoraphidium minutum]